MTEQVETTRRRSAWPLLAGLGAGAAGVWLAARAANSHEPAAGEENDISHRPRISEIELEPTGVAVPFETGEMDASSAARNGHTPRRDAEQGDTAAGRQTGGRKRASKRSQVRTAEEGVADARSGSAHPFGKTKMVSGGETLRDHDFPVPMEDGRSGVRPLIVDQRKPEREDARSGGAHGEIIGDDQPICETMTIVDQDQVEPDFMAEADSK